VTPVATGAGVVTGSVQYQDVGLKLEFEPQVYSEDEVGIKISLEVSSIVKEISGPNGSLAYQIGTRNAQTVVRLRDGENQILGGLISSEDRTTAAKVPGLGQLPVLGRLFSNNNGNTIKTEIILSITPRILRAPANIDSSLREVYSGTEASIRQRQLQLDPVGSARMQSAVVGPIPAPSLPPPVAVPTVAPVLPAPAAPAAPSPSTSRPMVPTVAPATAPPSATPATAPSTTGPTPAPAAAAYMRNLLPYMNGSRYPRPAAPAAAQPTGEAASAPAAESAASATRSAS
jgi:general secretion pathway protein D